ncbi:hypothetical protein CPARA_3gp374 (nucleomorph) [Cryptomonas paramecium]|uniref:Uncharacterized protein n=1 Tax=Cryptomonas paramaecium TaxID=2898 RepID=F2HIA8_9CRYP|nr:hypothetical protein CPARA_3gp374 [Cryptomonas paramecium]AEA39032.1 hypothetical protein CPARA_3gp374 [Cryptomonas paramecium]
MKKKIQHIKTLAAIIACSNNIKTLYSIQKYKMLHFLDNSSFLFCVKRYEKKAKSPFFYTNINKFNKPIFISCSFFSSSEYAIKTNVKFFYNHEHFVLEYCKYMYFLQFFYDLKYFIYYLFAKNISNKTPTKHIITKNWICEHTLLYKEYIDFMFLHLSHFLFFIFNVNNMKSRAFFFKLFYENFSLKLSKFQFFLKKNEINQIYKRVNFFLKKNKLAIKLKRDFSDEFGFFFLRKEKTVFFLWGDFFLEN